MFATGVGIPIMAALNSGLGTRLRADPWLAAFILLLTGAVVSGVALLVIGLPSSLTLGAAPMFYLGGFLVAFYVLSVTAIAPRIGVGNAIFFVLLGQVLAAATIDRFGLFGAPEAPVTARRSGRHWTNGRGRVFLARRISARLVLLFIDNRFSSSTCVRADRALASSERKHAPPGARQ